MGNAFKLKGRISIYILNYFSLEEVEEIVPIISIRLGSILSYDHFNLLTKLLINLNI